MVHLIYFMEFNLLRWVDFEEEKKCHVNLTLKYLNFDLSSSLKNQKIMKKIIFRHDLFLGNKLKFEKDFSIEKIYNGAVINL